MRNIQTCISTPIENWTHVYMNLFTRDSPYYHLLNYLLFLLKYSVYMHAYILSTDAWRPFVDHRHLSDTQNNYVLWEHKQNYIKILFIACKDIQNRVASDKTNCLRFSCGVTFAKAS